jgi:hypothetical protein
MTIYIEILVIVVLILFFFMWTFWKGITDWFYAWRYKKNNDRKNRKQGEELNRGGNTNSSGSSLDIPRPTQPERRGVLPPTEANTIRKDSNGSRKANFVSLFRRKG